MQIHTYLYSINNSSKNIKVNTNIVPMIIMKIIIIIVAMLGNMESILTKILLNQL